jgi:hypothetical protein
MLISATIDLSFDGKKLRYTRLGRLYQANTSQIDIKQIGGNSQFDLILTYQFNG